MRAWAEVRAAGTFLWSAAQIDNAASTRHTLTFVGLQSCTPYDYQIAFLDDAFNPGPIQHSGTFVTACQ